VTWNVLEEPIELSSRQIEELTTVHGDNNRPRQPLNGRSLSLSG
jgi:carbonic anhydrase